MAQRDASTNLQIASVAQKDARTNLQIAREAKADSSAMKTIAALTMVFLPATFMSSVFGMGSLATRSWELYVAISLPLTAFVLGIWWFWAGTWWKSVFRNLRIRLSWSATDGAGSHGRDEEYQQPSSAPERVVSRYTVQPHGAPVMITELADISNPDTGKGGVVVDEKIRSGSN